MLSRKLDFKPLVFGTFAEMSSSVKDFVDTAGKYAIDHLGASMAAMTPELLGLLFGAGSELSYLWRRGEAMPTSSSTEPSMLAWEFSRTNKAQVRQDPR